MMHSRARRPLFVDVRFIAGIVLVIVSVAGVWLLVSSSRQTTPVLQATRTIVTGEPVGSADLQVVEVALGSALESYLAPQDLAPGAIAMRTLPKGELVPSAAVGDAEDVRTTTVVVSSGTLPADTGPGDVVELWHAPLLKDGRAYDTPRILVADAVVASVAEAEGMLASSRTDVELVIERTDVAEVLTAITGEDAISLVPKGSGS